MAKNPHPSGKPVRHRFIPKKAASSTWHCPLETPATPQLRPRSPVPVVDAIGYLRVDEHPDEDHTPMRIGFVDFGEA
jgi:hypothetical protein